MDEHFIDLTPENLAEQHLCCIIRTKKPHPGVEIKRRWLAERLAEGHVFRKLDVKGTVFIEYAPLERAWVPVVGQNYLYIYCLWVLAPYKGKGYGRALLESCIADAKAAGKSGLCILSSKRQKNWLTSRAFARRYGFETVDETADGYELLALALDDGETPRFAESARRQRIDGQELTIYYSPQCPFIPQKLEAVENWCAEKGVPLTLCPVDSLEKAKRLPGVFNNYGAFYKGEFLTVNLLELANLEKLFKE